MLVAFDAADVGQPALVAFDPSTKVMVQAVARNEAHSLQAPVEEGAPGCSFPVVFHMN